MGFPGTTLFERVVAAGDAIPELLREDINSFRMVRNGYAHEVFFALTDESLDAYIALGDSIIARLCKQLGKPVEKFDPRPTAPRAERQVDSWDEVEATGQPQPKPQIVSPLPRDPEYDEIYAKHEAHEIDRLAEDRRLLEDCNGDYELFLAKREAVRNARAEIASARRESERQEQLKRNERERQEERERIQREAADREKKRKREAEIASLEQQISKLRSLPTGNNNRPSSGFWGTVVGELADFGLNMSKANELEKRLKVLKAER
jgi:hypothetical protein